MPNVIRFAARFAEEVKTFAIEDTHGKRIHVYNVALVRLFSEAFHARYEVFASKGMFGVKQPDGNWTGMIGMLMRSEVDVSIQPVALESDTELIKFSYPFRFEGLTFMTDKPQYVSMSSAIFHPFPREMWVALAALLFLMPFILYVLLDKKIRYQRVLMNIYGTLIEQAFSFELGRNNLRLLLFAWLLGAMIVSNGYKALLLSSLSFPNTVGIRDISDLAKASTKRSVKCFSFPGDNMGKIFLKSNIDSWREIGGCLEEHKILSDNYKFYEETSRKALIGSRDGLSFDSDIYFVSQDTFYPTMYSFRYSRKFCCPKHFDRLINRFASVGIFQKIDREEKFFYQLRRIFTNLNPFIVPRKIDFSDISGAFTILLIGWISAALVFVFEIFINKYITRKR